MTPQDAKLALDMIAKVGINASDEAIAQVARLRAGLHKIASGTLIVTAPPKQSEDSFDDPASGAPA